MRAWVTMCVQHDAANARIVRMCAASIASFLVASNTSEPLAVLADGGGAHALRQLNTSRAVRIVQLQAVADDARRIEWPAWATPERVKRRSVTIPRHVLALCKMQVWTLTEYEEVVYFDTDVLFLRNPQPLMTHSPAFAAIALTHIDALVACRGLRYMNAGVMKLRPSLAAYDTLRATLLHSNYTDCGGEPLTDQDVVRQLAFNSSVLGTFHQWPLCFNYRGWPNQRHCLKDEGPILYHQSMHGWPKVIRAANGSRVPTAELLAWAKKGVAGIG